MSRRIKLLYIIPSLDAGGAQRVSLHLLRNFSRDVFEIQLLLLKKEGEFVHEIPRDIITSRKNHSRMLTSLFSIGYTIWRNKPDVVFTTLGPLNILVASIRWFLPRSVKFIARESSILSSRNKDEKYTVILNRLYRTFYNNFDAVICQSKYMHDDLLSNYQVKRSKLKIVYNPVDFSTLPDVKPSAKRKRIELISVGRLAPEKGYDRIIKAFSTLIRGEYRLTILGEGPLKVKLQELIDDYQLSEDVRIVGYVDRPYTYIQDSDCLIVGSRYEGFPNVILEANACGIPAIAFNSPGGIKELIINGFNGWLVEDDDTLALAERIKSKIYLTANREKIKEFILGRFSIAKIMHQYESIIINEVENQP